MADIKSRLIAGALSILIIVLLVLSGPAEAFLFNFSISDSSPFLGDMINFLVSAKVESNDMIDITNFTLLIRGADNISCVFSINGFPLSGCRGISIEQTENTSYGYGYLLPGFIKYTISMNSSLLGAGSFSAGLTATTSEGERETSKSDFIVNPPLIPVEKCSLRATNGEVLFGNISIISNRLNLALPLSGAKIGKGTLTSQEKNNRISYSFDIINAYQSGNLIFFRVSGLFRDDLKPRIEENATIIFNKALGKTEIYSNSFSAREMKTSVLRGC